MIRTERLRLLVPWAGPLLIVGAVLIVLHGFAWGGLMSTQHIDVMPQWLPNYCFLGRSLSHFHIPDYNPYSLAGAPFASDPQSGWTYLPAMLLFSAFSCGRAIRWFVVLQPILAGLGAYAFLRSERLSRAAATASGLVLALVMADSYIALSLPFAGTLAWSALLLAAASRFMRAAAWPGRFGWAIAVALAWGQLANAHLSNGLLMGTGALAVYLAVRFIDDLRAGGWRTSALAIGLLVVALPSVGLAVLWPRLAFLHRSSLAMGYPELQHRAYHLAHRRPVPWGIGAANLVNWPLGLTTSPGSYLGAIGLGLTFAGWRVRRHVGLVVGLAMYGLVCYVLSLQAVAQHFRSTVLHTGPGQLWLHEPSRFRFGTLLAMALLVGFGVEAWRTARRPTERAAMLVPAVLVFGVLPPITHVSHDHTGFVIAMAVVGAVVLGIIAWRPPLIALVPAVLAIELVANGLVGQGAGYTLSGVGIERPGEYIAWAPLRKPNVDVSAYLRPTPISKVLRQREARYVPLAREGFRRERGYLLLQRPRYWGLLANERSMLFRARDAQGYNPAQLPRYWTFIRAADPKYIKYNGSFLTPGAAPAAFDLLGVHLQIASSAARRGDLGIPQTRDGPWRLYLFRDTPLASVVSRWTVTSPARALAAVLGDGFRSEERVMLERDPGISPPGPRSSRLEPANADLRWSGLGSASIETTSPGPALVLVRIPFDTAWHATVDGHATAVLHADYVDMAVVVPGGRHVVELRYDDPRLGYGMIGSAAALLALVAAGLLARRRKSPPPG
ncbi:MAG: hypothetical protein ABR600_07780 [Actinomycetota bacterium]